MIREFHRLNRRRFLRGAGYALALPGFASLNHSVKASEEAQSPKRLACFYFPDGVPMPLPEDPAFQDWAWFPHGAGDDFKFTKCMSP